MAGYPITLHLENKPVLIVGGGKVASRKAPALIAAGAKLSILSPSLHESLDAKSFHWIQADYKAEILAEIRPVLLFAATNQPQLNQQILQDARQLVILSNISDEAESSDFHNMALLEKAPFTIAMSSNAVSPALLHLLRERIDAVLTDGLIQFANWLGLVRSASREKIARQEDRQALYEHIIASDVLRLLEAGKTNEAKTLFNSIIEETR